MSPSLESSLDEGEFDGQFQHGLARLIQTNTQIYSDNVALEHGLEKVTYTGLHRKAQYLHHRIQAHYIRCEEPIGILASQGINQVVAQVGIIYAGGSCVPLDIEKPDSHLEDMLLSLECSLILADKNNCRRLKSFQCIPIDHMSEQCEEWDDFTVSNNLEHCCSHILHTSGSTGKPKAVEVLAAGIINISNNAAFQPIGRGYSRVGHASAITFDVSLWEIYGSILQGGTLVIFDKQVMLNPEAFREKLRDLHVDVMWQTTSLLATITHVCPDAYADMDCLLTGGEAINPHVIRRIFANGPPRRIFNVYGPTEASCFAMFHQVRECEAGSGIIPIGKPFHNYAIHVVDKDLHQVQQGEVGELVIGGIGVSRGYPKDPEKTAESFVISQSLKVDHPRGTGRLYRTGDFARINHEGLFEYIGRMDNQVKIHGHRVELESVELLLVETKLVNSAVALKMEMEESQGGTFLLAYVVPASQECDTQSIRDEFSRKAPNAMVPRLVLSSNISLTSSCKADRKELAVKYRTLIESTRLSRIHHTAVDLTITERQLQFIWLDLLGLPIRTLRRDDDFFGLGGTSLQAAGLFSKIRSFMGTKLTMKSLFDHPTLLEMASLIDGQQNGVTHGNAERETLLQDIQLGNNIKPIPGIVPDWTSESEGNVILTGATGFLGIFMLAELVARPYVRSVVCLVRASDHITALSRIMETLEKYRIRLNSQQKIKILASPADFATPDLGLGTLEYDRLAVWGSVIFHLGAHVHYVQPYRLHRASNVLGTIHVLQFANSGRLKGVHYTSSISVYGPTGFLTGRDFVAEDEKPKSHIDAILLDTGYAQSKFVAESIVWGAIEKGFPVSIYRPTTVLGHSKKGTTNPNDLFGRVASTSIQMGQFPLLVGVHEGFVSVDFVVSSLLSTAISEANHGHAYNLTHPRCDKTLDVSDTLKLLNSLIPSSPMQGVSFSEWVSRLSQHDRHSALYPLIPFLEEQVVNCLTRWEAQKDTPIWGTANLRRALLTSAAPMSLECPGLETLLPKYLSDWQRSCSNGKEMTSDKS
ncbi:uncharacterized protein N7511_009412 [Penicillium nucicola]|uniref:uncharacterized protein n=1 Tax=Penicillium nucicola TaxID=1850975 RepID=UPI002545AF88|nr:uncharacterized protein N7511_009412 [Penicillium nucicola]KAJ5747716.1 hypothetical protein N7511_009412 [Penicillium nucicola]